GAALAVITPDALDQFVADDAQPGVGADGFGPGPAQLDAVVGGRVVAGGEHCAGAVQQPRREVELSVDANPIRTTSRPWSVTPVANAAASDGELSRMSWPITTCSASSARIN